MEEKLIYIGWIGYDTKEDADNLITQINICKGFPTPDGKTLTWTIPSCLSNGYYPTATTQNYYVIIKDEIMECLSQEQKDSIIFSLPENYITCGTPIPTPSGSTENYV